MIPFPPGKFKVILADPPWQYEFAQSDSRSIEAHYQSMSVGEIKALPVQSISEADSVLLLWGTWPKLKEALEVMEAWGFEYKTVAFVWVKTNQSNNQPSTGMGYYTRGNTEFCLLGIKGKPLERFSHSVGQVVFSDRKGHSEKPEEVRVKIEQLFGDVPRLELFARRTRAGWQSWGNEKTQEEDLKKWF